MTLRNVRLVFAKEMRDTLRDRRTLFIAIVLPILLYPLLMIGLSQVMMAANVRIKERVQKVALEGAGGPAAERVRERLAAEDVKLEVVATPDPAAALAAGEIEAWVRFDPGFEEAIAAGEQGQVALSYDSTRDDSQAAQRKLARALTSYGTEVLRDRGLSEADIEPVQVEDANQASTTDRGAKQFGPMLALLMVIMALSGAFYPAVDIMAGEKERGTMETLLVCPARRTEIVVGKYLTVLTMTLVTALLNFASMGITFAHFAGMLPAGRTGGTMELDITFAVAGKIVLALLPLAMLFSAVALALSTFARSYKEGQHYLTPLFVGVMPLSMVAIVPGTKLATFAAVPVAGVVLLVRDLLLGTAPLGDVFIVLATTFAFAAAAIWWTVKMFNREDVLFRDPGGTQFTLLRRATKPGETPQPAQAAILAAIILVVVFFVAPRFLKLRHGVLIGFLVQFLLIFGLAPVLAAKVLRLDLKKTFSLRMPPPEGWLAALLGAPALLVITMTLLSLVGVVEESNKLLEEEINKTIAAVGLPLLILVPPFVEEILFRGFLLSGFRRGRSAIGAVIIVAAIFAFYHQMPARYLPTGLIGLWLGYLVVATGSLYPAILGHLVNNAIPLVVFVGLGVELEVPFVAVFPALAAFAGAVWLAERARRRTKSAPDR